MPKLKIKKGDNVVVISGRDKGKQRRSAARLPDEESRLIVQGIHVARRHTKQSMGNPGGIVEKELTIHVSNVAHIDPQIRQADPGRLQDARGRPQGPRRPALRRSASTNEERAVRTGHDPPSGTLRHGRAGELMKEFGYANKMQAPRLEKIVVNMGVGEAVQERRRSTPRSPT